MLELLGYVVLAYLIMPFENLILFVNYFKIVLTKWIDYDILIL